MRHEFIEKLLEHAKESPAVWLLTADLGYSYLERFAQAFPERFVNVGVAEQNMVSVGAGLAMTGQKVFVYSIINFLTFRALEQIRQDVCYHRLSVHLVGVGAGFAYKEAGYSHYAIEDIAIMGSLPHLRIYSPADGYQTERVMEEISKIAGPTYIRLGANVQKQRRPILGSVDQGFVYQQGSEIVCAVLGDLLDDVFEPLQRFFRIKNIVPTIFSVVALKPFDATLLEKYASSAAKILVFERHKASGLTAQIYTMKIKNNLAAAIDSYCLPDDATDASSLPCLETFLHKVL